MLHLFKRHPFPVQAQFEQVLVLTYAWPAEILEPLLPPGLMLDRFRGEGFVAIALVQTRKLRPTGWPEMAGRDFFLSGYRIFARHTTKAAGTLRGLRILRSETDSRVMKFFGNLLTHYNYQHASLQMRQEHTRLELEVLSGDGRGDLKLSADLRGTDQLPASSPFATMVEARRFAGPLPYTFDYEKETHSIIRIKGHRPVWKPRMVEVRVDKLSFFQQQPFARSQGRLASCFYVEDIPYRWEKGVRESL